MPVLSARKRLNLLLNLRRLTASLSADEGNPDRLGSDDAQAIERAAEALTAAVEKLSLLPGGDELAIAILEATEELAARAPINATRMRVYEARQRRKNSEQGKRSGQERSRKADEAWRLKALELAQQKREAVPSIPSTQLVNLIIREMKQAPGPASVERLLRKAASEGKLTPRRSAAREKK